MFDFCSIFEFYSTFVRLLFDSCSTIVRLSTFVRLCTFRSYDVAQGAAALTLVPLSCFGGVVRNRDAVTRAGADHRSRHATLQSVLLLRLWQQSCGVAGCRIAVIASACSDSTRKQDSNRRVMEHRIAGCRESRSGGVGSLLRIVTTTCWRVGRVRLLLAPRYQLPTCY